MIDLHCHLIPGLDDGAEDLEVALEMARLAVADGITITACTPHILPGVYENSGPAIRAAAASLQATLADRGVPCTLFEATGRVGGRMDSDRGSWASGQVTEHCGELIDTGLDVVVT